MDGFLNILLFSCVSLFTNYEYQVLVLVQCHDAMITNKINLFGLARVEDKCETQTRFIAFMIIPS